MKGLIFTYLLTYGGAVLSFFQPFYGLLIYISFSILKPEALWYFSVPQGNYSRIVALALLLGWAFAGFGNWDLRRSRPILYLLLGFFGWMVLSAFNAQVSSTVAFYEVEAMLKIVLPFIAGLTLIESVGQLKALAWVIMLSQGFVAYEFNLAYYDGFNRVLEVGLAGMDNNSISIAMVCAAGLAFFMGMGEKRLWRKAICFVAAALMIHVPMFGQSRGGQLAVVVTGVVSFLLIRKKPKDYAIFGLAVIGGLMLAGPSVRERFSTAFADEAERDASAHSRLELWEDCWDVMLNNPILGVGPGHWQQIAHTYGWTENKAAHSVWFETGANLGFPGIGFLLAFYGVTIWSCWKLIRRPPLAEPYFADISKMVIAALVGFGVAASFVSLVGLELPYYIVLLGASSLKVASFYERAPLSPIRQNVFTSIAARSTS